MRIHLPPTIMVSSVVLSIVLHYLIPYPKLISSPYNLFGLVAVVSGLLLIRQCRRLLEVSRTTIDPKENPTALLTKGPYRYSRNPIYGGLLLITFGIAFTLASPIAFIGPVVFFLFIHNNVIPREEKNLTNAFGVEYERYQTRVRRWI